MDAIGTVTMYFPFLDNESRTLLQTTMDDANNYHDFVMRLNEKVLSENVPDLAIYFAIHHSGLLLDMESIALIGKKYGKLPILRPNLFFTNVLRGKLEDVSKVHESADAVLATDPPNWLAIEMRFLKFEIDLLQYPKTLYDTSNLEALEVLIGSSPQFEFFENILHDFFREKASRDGDTVEGFRCVNLAIESAKKHNDIVRLAYYLRFKFDYLQTSDLGQARNALLQAHNIMASLGNRAGEASTLFYLAKTDAVRGEYNLAIERIQEVMGIRESMDLPIGVHAVVISTYYNAIAEPEAAMEWAKLADDDSHTSPLVRPRAILNQAWSNILMGEYGKAQALIDSARELILKSGVEILLAWTSFISGIYEMGKGDFASAARSMRNAFDMYETKGSLDITLIFLHYLAQLDTQLAILSIGEKTEENARPWLKLLEERATADDLPGISGQVYLLKVRLARAQNDEGSLEMLIDRIRALGKSSTMTYLNDRLERILEGVQYYL